MMTFPDTNHSFIFGGGMCEVQGRTYDGVTPAFAWLLPRLRLEP